MLALFGTGPEWRGPFSLWGGMEPWNWGNAANLFWFCDGGFHTLCVFLSSLCTAQSLPPKTKMVSHLFCGVDDFPDLSSISVFLNDWCIITGVVSCLPFLIPFACLVLVGTRSVCNAKGPRRYISIQGDEDEESNGAPAQTFHHISTAFIALLHIQLLLCTAVFFCTGMGTFFPYRKWLQVVPACSVCLSYFPFVSLVFCLWTVSSLKCLLIEGATLVTLEHFEWFQFASVVGRFLGLIICLTNRVVFCHYVIFILFIFLV